MDTKRFAMELEVSPGVMKAPGWHLFLSYEQKVREAAMDLVRMQCLPLAAALDRVRNDQEHRMFHCVQLLMQPGHQRATSAPASSSGSSSSAKRSAAAASTSQPSEVTALTSKLDKLASTVKLLADRSSSGGKVRDRSRSPRVSRKKGSQGKAGKGRGTFFEDLVRQHKDKFVPTRVGQEVCFKFQDGNCTDQVVYEVMCAQDVVATRRGSNADA